VGRQNVPQYRYGRGPTDSPTPEYTSLAKQTDVREMLEDMQRRGVIEESDSSWSSIVVLVQKNNGDLSFCVDYRKLNVIKRKDRFPLPRIEDTLEEMARTKWFSSLNLRSRYWPVDIHPDDKETAFSTGQGLWQFTIMSFGPCNAPETFENLMKTVLIGLTYDSCLVYVDDVNVIGRKFKEHLLNLPKMLQRFGEVP
jgi:hypothetical protein